MQTQVAGEFAASAIPALEDGFMHGLEVCLYLTVNALHSLLHGTCAGGLEAQWHS